jgi:hypothetical protein
MYTVPYTYVLGPYTYVIGHEVCFHEPPDLYRKYGT